MPGSGGGPAPLDGIRVLDLSRVVSGPLCGRMLADLGAEVIKVEPPDGDVSRRVAPTVGGISAYFTQLNAGKRNVCIDLKAPGGPALVGRLAAVCDVLIENFRPGVLARYGLDAPSLLARTPGLVYCSISGWGQQGPWSSKAAYAPIVHAEAGTMAMAAKLRRRPAEQEVQVHGDVYPAILAANAILAALLQRGRTGRGQHIDVAMAEVLAYTNEWTAVEWLHFGPDRAHDIWTHPVLHVGDGTAVALVGNPLRMFEAWIRALSGDPAILEDPRFVTEASRETHRDEALAVLAGLVATCADVVALEAALEGWPMLVGEVRSVEDLAVSDWAVQRGLSAEVAPGLRVPAAPWRSADAAIGVRGPAAQRGQHNRAVLGELLGVDSRELAELEATGAVVPVAEAPTVDGSS